MLESFNPLALGVNLVQNEGRALRGFVEKETLATNAVLCLFALLTHVL